jgi:hypothetical protein
VNRGTEGNHAKPHPGELVSLPYMSKAKKVKAIPVTGHEGLWGCEMLRIPHCLDSRLTDDGKVDITTHRPRSTPQKHYFSASGTLSVRG